MSHQLWQFHHICKKSKENIIISQEKDQDENLPVDVLQETEDLNVVNEDCE